MSTFRNVPELVRVNGRWVFDDFRPTQAAFTWGEDFRGKTGVLYVVESAGHFKIGISTNFKRRFAGLQSAIPTPLRRVATRNVPLAGLAYAEAWLHKQHAQKRTFGEWFAITEREAVSLLSKAVIRAKAYDVRCAEWWRDEQIDRQSPKRREKAERQYAAFLAGEA